MKFCNGCIKFSRSALCRRVFLLVLLNDVINNISEPEGIIEETEWLMIRSFGFLLLTKSLRALSLIVTIPCATTQRAKESRWCIHQRIISVSSVLPLTVPGTYGIWNDANYLTVTMWHDRINTVHTCIKKENKEFGWRLCCEFVQPYNTGIIYWWVSLQSRVPSYCFIGGCI